MIIKELLKMSDSLKTIKIPLIPKLTEVYKLN